MSTRSFRVGYMIGDLEDRFLLTRDNLISNHLKTSRLLIGIRYYEGLSRWEPIPFH